MVDVGPRKYVMNKIPVGIRALYTAYSTRWRCHNGRASYTWSGVNNVATINFHESDWITFNESEISFDGTGRRGGQIRRLLEKTACTTVEYYCYTVWFALFYFLTVVLREQ